MIGHVQSQQLRTLQTPAESSNSSMEQKELELPCQDGRCALVEGENSTCCWVPANQTLLRVTGVNCTKNYSVGVSITNGAGEGELVTACEFLRSHVY